jgi:hypothetical protein
MLFLMCFVCSFARTQLWAEQKLKTAVKLAGNPDWHGVYGAREVVPICQECSGQKTAGKLCLWPCIMMLLLPEIWTYPTLMLI